MQATVTGKVVNIGESEFNGKVYPFFELLQVGTANTGSYIARISGDGEIMDSDVSVLTRVTVSDKGGLKFKKISSKLATKGY